VDVLAVAFPILAITPTTVRPGPFDPGPFDPGGIGTRINAALSVLITAAGLAAAVRSHRNR
jgi:hypothetical protein